MIKNNQPGLGFSIVFGIACICGAVSPSADTSILYCNDKNNCIVVFEGLPPRNGWSAIEKRRGNGLLKTAAAAAALGAFGYSFALSRRGAIAEPHLHEIKGIWEQMEVSKAEMLAGEALRQFNNELTQQAADTYFAQLPPEAQAQLMGQTWEQSGLPAAADDSVQNPAPLETPAPAPDNKALRLLDSAVTTNRSTLLVGATGTGKSVTDAYILHQFMQRYPQAEIWAIAQKNDSFNGLDRRDRVTLFDSTDPQATFAPLDLIWEEYERRRRAREGERDFRDRPIRLKLADWHSIYDACRTEKWFAPYLQKLSSLITVGRELNIALLIDTQSFNLDALGLAKDANIRQNLNILAQGYSWRDSDGNIQGDYGVLTNLINSRYIIPDSGDRTRLQEELNGLKSSDKPVLFSAIGGGEIAVIPDIRRYKNAPAVAPQPISRDTLERIYQLEIDISNPEPLNRSSEPPNQLPIKDSSQKSNQFTKLNLPYDEARSLVARLRTEGMNQKKIIKLLWNATSGESKAFKEALKQFKELEE